MTGTALALSLMAAVSLGLARFAYAMLLPPMRAELGWSAAWGALGALALVRHNAEPAAWPAGIAAFTVVFAAGQIVGPSLVGLIADGPGGLARGFAVSAGLLALGAVLALGQRPPARARET